MPAIAYLSSVPVGVRTSGPRRILAIDHRMLSSLTEMARVLTGSGVDLHLLAPHHRFTDAAPGLREVDDRDLTFCVGDAPADSSALAAYDGVYALHRASHHWLMDSGVPYVVLSEFTPAIRRAMVVTRVSAVDRARIAFGEWRREPAYRTMIRRARGVQFNGVVAQRHYGRFARHSIVFNDSRITREDLAAARRAPKRGTRSPLTVAVSGRWAEAKGVRAVPALARALEHEETAAQIEMYGGGVLEPELRRAQGEALELVGFLDFESEWKPRMREHVDLLFVPHHQADPSCTYFEALGCGVPILCFDNATSRRIVADSGAGWVIPRSPDAAARLIADLAAHPAKVVEASARALDYMASRTFEDVTRRRAEHLLDVFDLAG
ncbi:MAG: glycosyltransferase [Bowdeniella nasicola]|nr:glycosyltransferase [Bowdeniella nasicola]